MTRRTVQQHAFIGQVKQVLLGLGEAFAPFCEVLVPDFLLPDYAIVTIHNNLPPLPTPSGGAWRRLLRLALSPSKPAPIGSRRVS